MSKEEMRDFGAIMCGLADVALARVFTAEWVVLPEDDARLIRQDFLEASEDKGGTAAQYARSIGVGNLQGYALAMRVRERRGWNRW